MLDPEVFQCEVPHWSGSILYTVLDWVNVRFHTGQVQLDTVMNWVKFRSAGSMYCNIPYWTGSILDTILDWFNAIHILYHNGLGQS